MEKSEATRILDVRFQITSRDSTVRDNLERRLFAIVTISVAYLYLVNTSFCMWLTRALTGISTESRIPRLIPARIEPAFLICNARTEFSEGKRTYD
jgi:hypothetical protein